MKRRVFVVSAIALGIASFSPWLAVLAAGSDRAASDVGWTSGRLSAPLYLGKWIFNAGTVFFDLDYVTLAFVPVALLLLTVAAWSCVSLVRRMPVRIWAFVILFGSVSAFLLLIPDLALHQSRAGQSRYLTPLWLAMELAVAYALVSGTAGMGSRGRLWRVALAVVLFAGIASCGAAAFARTWWIASNQKTLPAIASALAAQRDATLVYVDDDDMLLEMLDLSDPALRFDLHADIDAKALQSASRPFVIAKPFAIRESAVSSRLQAVPEPVFFPPAEDRAIEILHRRAAADRNMGAMYQNDALYGI